MEQHKALLQLLILVLLSSSYVLSLGTSSAAPLSSKALVNSFDQQGTLKFAADHEESSTTQANMGVQGYYLQEMNLGEEVLEEEEEGFILHGRMMAQDNDYPGTGANNNHDPKPPGGS